MGREEGTHLDRYADGDQEQVGGGETQQEGVSDVLHGAVLGEGKVVPTLTGMQMETSSRSEVARLSRKVLVMFFMVRYLATTTMTSRLPASPSTSVAPYTSVTGTNSSAGIV